MLSAAKNQNGITLIELMVVIGIIAIMVTLTALGVDYVRREKVLSTTKKILADFQKARLDALVTGPTGTTGPTPYLRGFGVRLTPPGSYTVFAFNDADVDFAYSGITDEANAQINNLSSGLSLQLNNPDYTVLIFDRHGVPARYKPDGTRTVSDLVLQVRDASGTNIKCIKVTASSIRGGQWDGATSSCKEQ